MKNNYGRFIFALQQILKPISCGGLFFPDGKGLCYRATTLTDIGTLPLACESATRYLKLAPGESLIVGDPACGSALLTDFTIIRGMAITGNTTDFLLAERIRTRPQLVLESVWPKDGFRIPPTPLTPEILEAIGHHPHCPKSLLPAVRSSLERLNSCEQIIREVYRRIFQGPPTKKWSEGLLASLSQQAEHLWEEIPFGSTQHQTQFDSGESLHVEVHHDSKGLRFDFSKSRFPKNYHLTYSMTLGATTGALYSFLGNVEVFHAGHLSKLEINTPAGSQLNATPHSATVLGELLVAPMIANTVTGALSMALPKKSHAPSGSSPILEFLFEDGRTFFERLPSGQGASADSPGEDSLVPWLRSELHPSLEEIEKQFPLRVLKSEKRANSGGRGARAGGNGVRRSYQLLAPAQVLWAFENFERKTEGLMGGSAADGCEITVSLPSGESLEVGSTGQLRVPQGAVITLLSSGGGGHSRLET